MGSSFLNFNHAITTVTSAGGVYDFNDLVKLDMITYLYLTLDPE